MVGFQGMLLPGAVPVSAIPWATPCAPPPDRLLQPTHAFVLSLPDPRDQASTPLRDTALTFLTHNWGDIAGQVSLARTWLEALSPDMVAEQELWDLAAARPALPPRYEAHYNTASGQGSGLRTAWLRSLRAPSQPADLFYDSPHWIASTVSLSLGGRALLFNTHLPPRLSYSEWVSEVKLMNHLRSCIRPDLCVLLGDLNSTGAPGTPLASALGALGPLSAWHRLVPPATPTNFTTRHGSPRSTAIDHIFATGPIASHTHHVLPCHTSHAMVLAQVTLHRRSCGAHSWRLFRWRLATIEDMDSLSAALDLACGWLSLTPSLPDHYIAAHHSLAHRLLPHPPDTPTLLRSLARFTFPLSTQDLAAQSSTLREASAARGYVSRAAVLSSPSLISYTKTALPSRSMADLDWFRLGSSAPPAPSLQAPWRRRPARATLRPTPPRPAPPPGRPRALRHRRHPRLLGPHLRPRRLLASHHRHRPRLRPPPRPAPLHGSHPHPQPADRRVRH